MVLVVALGLIAAGGLGYYKRMGPIAPGRSPANIAQPERRLRYYVTVQKYRDGKPFEKPFRLSGERVFEADYRIRLTLSGPDSGYLYVLNEGAASTAEK